MSPETAKASAGKTQTHLHRGNDKLDRMYTYAERLRWAMQQTEPPTSRRALALRVGIEYQSIQYLADPNRNAQGSRHTEAIARALGVSAQWLATGKGKPHRGRKQPIDQRAALHDCIRATRELLARLERIAQALEDGQSGN
ncbi:hypothetical protein [Cupriavidus campinensis]|uniref:Helix-turn-helix transcriptional regulator n=1 Tax=Cupriavidus campinensis TaxID=151783 RepID=A0AAE9KZH2_9BURK|nr:hypothetical protein [Cupriavidus campinensis]URF02817.1 hypothetical protein M5D45_09560 [Cupriavidus campinensis]